MKKITSKDNPLYKNALKLKKKKYRDETGLYILEGVKPLYDAVDTGTEVKTVFVREGAGDIPVTEKTETVILRKDLFDALSDTDTSQGIIAVAQQKICGEDEFFEAVREGNLLIMDRVQDPGNIGTMIRTAEAAGYRGIIMILGGGDIYGPKAVRAAAGSLFRLPVMKAASVKTVADMLKRNNKRITVTSPEADSSCFEADISDNTALVIGNEGRGVSREFDEAADIKISIPMEGSIESLNAAVAAGIIMYQSYNKKMRGR